MRRKDRELKEYKDITAILDECEVLRLGLCLENKPYLVPMNFAYELIGSQFYFYLHSALEGRKIDIIKQNNNVCFEVDCAYKKIPAEQACEWTAKFKSVVGEGKIFILDNDQDKKNALDVFMKKHGFHKEEKSEYNLNSVLILKIVVEDISGKSNIK
ncbi:hypothetical protein SAMN02745728_01287 [Desulfovibrio litoralis DSM 11393]|uniref:Pyridoxamine 5'-phosphate oxidase n=2 Tax=Desulfovibrio litoralis TaxID=466107 RepID=A0A1M7SVT6_9BACT|nr:hypothetical protein SAMN02745728_01287 [Desulfovibrio litoralis DSM 11393]